MAVERVPTTHAAVDLSRKAGVDLPITNQVAAILRGARSPCEVIRETMERSLKGE
jgi:glycerol-3-phosphate dehydrogenase